MPNPRRHSVERVGPEPRRVPQGCGFRPWPAGLSPRSPQPCKTSPPVVPDWPSALLSGRRPDHGEPADCHGRVWGPGPGLHGEDPKPVGKAIRRFRRPKFPRFPMAVSAMTMRLAPSRCVRSQLWCSQEPGWRGTRDAWPRTARMRVDIRQTRARLGRSGGSPPTREGVQS